MDPFSHLAHQRMQDLHATADAIRLERTATTTRITVDLEPAATPDPGASLRPVSTPEPILEVVAVECYADCDPAPRAVA